MFNDRLKEARKNAGLSQEKLGLMMGLKKQTISDYERGYSEPDMAKVAMMMKILNVDANFLWQDEMSQKKEPEISTKALAVARAYDQISDYGRAIINTVLEQEKLRRGTFAAKILSGIELDATGAWDMKAASIVEQREIGQDVEDDVQYMPDDTESGVRVLE